MSAQVTLMGTISEPSLRFTQGGKAVLEFSMVTKRKALNKDTGQWEDHEETWWKVTAWERLGENAAETLTKGIDVIVVGKAFMETYVGKDGEKRQSLRVTASSIGPDLRRATATVKKVNRDKIEAATGPQSFDDPWATRPAPIDEAPF
jgi:single-strand DNA-binding protein